MSIKKENFLIQVKYSDFLENNKIIKEHSFGFGGELYLSPSEILDYDPNVIEDIRLFAKNENIPFKLHAPIIEIEYSKKDETLQNLRLLYTEVIGVCKILDIDHVVAHAEFKLDTENIQSKEFKNAMIIWDDLCKELSLNNINISLENHFEKTSDSLIKLKKSIKCDNLYMCLDVGHANAFGTNDIEKWIESYPKGSIDEIHLADNMGDDDTHLVLGAGNIDFEKVLTLLDKRKEKLIYVLEPKKVEDVAPSLEFLKKINFF